MNEHLRERFEEIVEAGEAERVQDRHFVAIFTLDSALRYGLVDGETYTLEEVGRKLGVTRERVRQIEAQALSRLRHPTHARRLRDYLER